MFCIDSETPALAIAAAFEAPLGFTFLLEAFSADADEAKDGEDAKTDEGKYDSQG